MVNSLHYRLGLDLGASSLGWALIGLNGPGGEPDRIIAAGVRIFEAGVEGDIEQGKDASRAVVRREARQPRRQQWRRQARKRKLFRLLQTLGFLPPSTENDSEARKAVLDQLDADLSARLLAGKGHDAHQKLPYLLRDMASSGPVEPLELGRALYHLAQRRGYLSNRKGQGSDKDEEEGVVLGSISKMDEQLKETGLNLGAYFNKKVNPTEERIRRRWLGRKQYRDEFLAIKAAQGDAHPKLDKATWKKIDDAIFFQRPLKSQKHLIGRCELEFDKRGKGLRRCPLAHPVAQQFRILQKVNDLRVTTPTRLNDPLSPKESQTLLDALQTVPELKWGKIKSLLKLNSKTAKFSLEEWDEKIIGNRTNAKLLGIFGERWNEYSPEEQTAIALEVLHYIHPEALQARAMKAWGLNEDAAWRLAFKTHLEEDYASHSLLAMQKLISGKENVPGLKDGGSYSTLKKELYPERVQHGKVFSKLPPINDWKSDIRNPAVIRALTETRKVVNAIIRKYGKPEYVHIELARELRNSRMKRKDIWTKNKENEKRREKAAAEITKELKRSNPSRRDIEKWLLATECNWDCPYCGDSINRKSLLGDDASYNIEHIYPRRYLDDSYLNKTIACRRCNDQKGDLTPAQAFHGDQYVQILQRVDRFTGFAREIKLARFKTEEPDDGFVERQLNDTKYNSRVAAELMQLLYGGHRYDKEGHQRVITPTGMLTGKVRANWQLNDLLGIEDGEKDRQDHRHHAIDAVVIALMTQKEIQLFAAMAQKAETEHSRHYFASIDWPWATFKNDVAYAIEAINVSHRPTRTIAGPLHAESLYSKNHGTDKKPEFRIRKELRKLTGKEIEGDQIVDPGIRIAVQQKWEEQGRPLPSKLWGTIDQVQNFPVMPPSKKRREKDPTATGTIIRKVRLKTDAKPRSIARGSRERKVASGKDSNYASLIFAVLDKQGKEIKWEHEILDRLTAHRILSANHRKKGEKVLLPQETETRKFKFALRKNDMLYAKGGNGDDILYRVQSLSLKEIQLCPHTLQGLRGKARSKWDEIQSIDNLRKYAARPCDLNPLGEIYTGEAIDS